MHKATAAGTLRLPLLLFGLLLPLMGRAQRTINVPGDQPTIQAGINAAINGDTVLVASGKYVENIDFTGKAITVTSSGGAASTILDGGGAGPAAIFQTAESRSSVLSGFTIQNAGGFGTNTTVPGIAGVVVSNSSPAILNNIITQNQCWNVEVLYGAPLVQGNTISSTQSPSGGCGAGSGAGVYIGGNLGGGERYGAANAAQANVAVIERNTIENNTIPESLNIAPGSTNLMDTNGGAAIAVLDGSPLIENNILRNNAAPGGNGGAINIAGGYGTAVLQNLIYGNSAGCGGGAISFANMDPVIGLYLLVANNTLVDNSAGTDGPYASCGDISQIYGFDYGLSEPDVVFVNNIVSSTTSDVPSIGCFDTLATPNEALQSIFDHNLLYNGGGAVFGPTCVDVSARYGNVLSAPQFTNAAQNDYHLSPTSPGVDTGDNSVLGNISELTGSTLATDFDGNARVEDATQSSYPDIDMGVYERAGAINGGTTTIVLTASLYGGMITLTGQFASALGVPTGSGDFFLDAQKIGTAAIASNGTVTLEVAQPAVGVHSLYVAYQGHNEFPPARSVIIIVPVEAPSSDRFATTLDFGTPLNPQQVGINVPFTIEGSSADPNPAFVPSPVTLTFDGTVLASVTLNNYGIGHYATSTLPVGYDAITALYAGDATHQAATSTFTEHIVGIGATTTLACTPATVPIGNTALLSAQVNADGINAPTGAVIFSDDNTSLAEIELTKATTVVAGQPAVVGSANFTYLGQAAGSHTLLATYAASGPYEAVPPANPPLNQCTETVVGLASTSVLTVTPTSAPYLTTTNLSVTVSPSSPPGLGTPTGTVTFLDGAKAVGTVILSGGLANLSTNSLPIGANSLTCMYSGDSSYEPGNCNAVLVHTAAAQPTLTITPSANPAPALTQVTFELALTASGQPAPGNPFVLFTISGQVFPLTLSSKGTAAYVTSSLLPGTYPVTASFAGDANLLSASASSTETVVASPSATALSVAPSPGYVGQPVTLTAMVTAQDALVPIGGLVTFYDGTAVLGTGTLDQSRTATLTTSSLTAGMHSLTATYPGGSVFTGSTSQAVSETILASSFTIALSPSTVTLRTDQSATVAIQLAGIGGFAGPLNLIYGTLPLNASANIAPQFVTLAAGVPGASTLTLNTATPTPVAAARATPKRTPAWPAVVMAMLVLFVPWRGGGRALRAGGAARKLLWLALTAVFLQTIIGCGNRSYTLPGVAPGTYHIQITATDVNQNQQTATLILIVPPR